MKKNYKILQIASIVIITILFLSYSLYTLSIIKKQSELVNGIYSDEKVLSIFQDVLVPLKNAESARRGYIITHEKEYVTSYYSYVDNVEDAIINFRTLNFSGEYNKQFIDSLTEIISKKLQSIKSSIDIELNNPSNDSVQVALTNEGRQSMIVIRDIIQQMSIEKQQSIYVKYLTGEKLTAIATTTTYYFLAIFLVIAASITTIIVYYSKLIYRYDEKLSHDLNEIRLNAMKTISKLEKTNEQLRREVDAKAERKK